MRVVRVRGLHAAPRDARARKPALEHDVRLFAPVAEGDGAHVPQADGEEDEVAHPADRVAPVVEALLLARPRLRLDDTPHQEDGLALLDGLVAEAEHDPTDDGGDDEHRLVRVRVRVRLGLVRLG